MKLHYTWNCPWCPEVFESRRMFQKHKKEKHNENKRKRIDEKINRKCIFCNKILNTTSCGIKNHEKTCSKNPNRKIYNYDWCRTETFKKQQSKLMKERHKNGTACTFQNRKNQPHSYPEKWIIKVLENNFGLKENIDYITELPFHGYFLDFAWPEKRLCIEIDGELHRFEEQQKRDINKDEFLKNEGWKELRLKWSFILKNKESAIKIIKDFLNETGDITIPIWKSITELREEKHEQNELNGVLKDSKGKFCPRKLKEEEWNNRKEIIINSKVDFSKYGWKSEVERKTSLTRKEIENTVKHFKEDFSFAFNRVPGSESR